MALQSKFCEEFFGSKSMYHLKMVFSTCHVLYVLVRGATRIYPLCVYEKLCVYSNTILHMYMFVYVCM